MMTYSRDEIMSPHPIILIKALTQAFRNPQIYYAYTFPSAKVCLPIHSHPETQLWSSHSPIFSDRSARGMAQHGNWMSVVLRGRPLRRKFHVEIKRAGIAKDRRKQIGWSPSLGPRGLQHNIENSGAGATSSHNPMTGCGLLKITFQVKKNLATTVIPRREVVESLVQPVQTPAGRGVLGSEKGPWAWPWSSFCVVLIGLCHSTFKRNEIKGNCTVILWPYPAFKMLFSPFLDSYSHLAYLWSWLSSACPRPHCSPKRLQLRLLTWKATIEILSRINCSFIWLPLHLICSSVMTISGL